MVTGQRDLFLPDPSRIAWRHPRISGIAGKRLVAVDLPGEGSHQHELNGVNQLRRILGEDRIRERPIRWVLLSDEDGIVADARGHYTWYDAREPNPKRSAEYRLYYDSENLLDYAVPGDVIILAAIASAGGPDLVAFVLPAGSTVERQLCWLFGLDPDALEAYAIPDVELMVERSRQIPALDLLELLGLTGSGEATAPTDIDLVRRRFGEVFPTTSEMSAFAREERPRDGRANPDTALMDWLEREEELFRALEGHIVGQRLDEGFASVDEFIAFSLSVHNRRKARMGWALENHLRQVFDDCTLDYSHNAVTENNARPDFLFPGIVAYLDPASPDDRLFMLGAKSTCKDRWRQVLAEAARITRKHLCTLEPGISVNQTEEMKASEVVLVIPAAIHETYLGIQREEILSLAAFVDLVTT